MPQQTVLQELIEKLNGLKALYNNKPDLVDFGRASAYSDALLIANKLLEKEKKVILDAFDKGNNNILAEVWFSNGEEYFNRTFKN